MGDVGRLLHAHGGVLRARDLCAAGIDRHQLERGAFGLRSLRHGWYAAPAAHPDVVTAVMAGGCLTCVSVLRLRGVWIPPVPRGVHARRSRYGVSRSGVVWCPVPAAPVVAACDPLPLALRSAVRCLSAEDFIVVCDSVLHLGLATEGDLREWLPRLPAAKSLTRCDGRAESGTESMVRLRLRAAGIRVEVQVLVPDVGRVDLLVGRRLIVECDSRQHHADPGGYRNDRRRDRAALVGRYLSLRLTYEEIVYDWPAVMADILVLIRRGDHR